MKTKELKLTTGVVKLEGDWGEKAFGTHRENAVLLQFPNGNVLSTIWGVGTYSENHDRIFDPVTLVEKFTRRLDSNTVEIMPYSKDKALLKKIFRRFGMKITDNTVIGYLTMTDWLWVVNQLAKEKK